MEIKVNYTAEKGLVQELVGDGQGVFNVEGVQIGQNVLSKTSVNAESLNDPKVHLDIKDIFLVTTQGTGNTEHITLKVGEYVGQIVTIVYVAEGAEGDSLQVFGEHTVNGINSPKPILSGLVTNPVSVATGSTERVSIRIMWLGEYWVPLGL